MFFKVNTVFAVVRSRNILIYAVKLIKFVKKQKYFRGYLRFFRKKSDMSSPHSWARTPDSTEVFGCSGEGSEL